MRLSTTGGGVMDLDQRVRSYVCDVVGDCSPDRVTVISRFESGERHAVYKVSYLDPGGGTNDLVVSTSSSEDTSDCARAEREAVVLEKVQGVAGPLLYDFRCESPWFDAPTSCTQFVPGQQRELRTAAPSDVERLGSVVGWLHELAVDDLVEWFPKATAAGYLDARLETIATKLSSVRDPLPVPAQRRLERAWLMVNESRERARTRESFLNDEDLVLLHGDVATGNIIWAPKPVLIDWEYARLGDPADEVAYVFSQSGLSAAQRNAFWRGYQTGTNHQRRLADLVDRVSWWEPVTLLGSVLWWVERWSRRADADTAGVVDPSAPRAQGYYLDHALRRLDGLDELLEGRGGTGVF